MQQPHSLVGTPSDGQHSRGTSLLGQQQQQLPEQHDSFTAGGGSTDMPGTFVNTRSSRSGKRMSRYRRNCITISRMERELSQKLAQAQRLEAEQSRLQAEHQLLMECCEGLALLRLRSSEHEAAAGAAGCAAEELALLQQLQGIPYSDMLATAVSPPSNSSGGGQGSAGSSGSPVLAATQGKTTAMAAAAARAARAASPVAGIAGRCAAAAAAVGAGRQLSPENDIMFYFRYLLSLPSFPGADTVTVRELATDYARTVQKLSLQLHLLQQPAWMQQQQQQPVYRLKALIDRHLHLTITLILLQRTEVMEGFMLTNFETLEVGEEHWLDKHEWVLKQIGITNMQVLAIGRATAFFERLMKPIMQERQELQCEIAQNGVGSSDSFGSSDEHKQRMAEREALLLRLSSLLRKEYLVRVAAACAVCGPLTYVQLAQLAVQMTPHPASFQLLGNLLQQQYRQQQAQQQQGAAAAPQKQRPRKARKAAFGAA